MTIAQMETQVARPVAGGRVLLRRRALVAAAGAGTGAALAALWPGSVLNEELPGRVVTAVLGADTLMAPIAGLFAAVAFALVTGVANTVTACNAAAISTLAPLAAGAGSVRPRDTLRRLGGLALGVVAGAGSFGAIVAGLGLATPAHHFHTAGTVGTQSLVAYSLVGLALITFGLVRLGVVADPLAGIARRFPHAQLTALGVVVGLALVGRPHEQFLQLFGFAAQTHNPGYGALLFALQAAGGLLVAVAIALALVHGTGGRFTRWISATPHRARSLVAASFLAMGTFTVLYWNFLPT